MGGIAADDGEHVLLERLGVERGPCLLDVVAERGQQGCRGAHRAGGRRVQRLAEVRDRLEGNAKRLRRSRDALKEGAFDMRRGVRVAGFCLVGGVEKGCAVAHTAGDDMLHRKAVPALVHVGADRIAPARGLEAEDAVARRRNADRAATIAGMRSRHHAGRNRHCRAAAGAARAVRGVPRVERGPVEIGCRLARKAVLHQQLTAMQDTALRCIRLALYYKRLFGILTVCRSCRTSPPRA